MNKIDLLTEVKTTLVLAGLNDNDYVFSLQGPTVILTTSGEPKMTLELRRKLTKLKVSVIG